MRKIHIILLAVTVIMALSSAYSLAAMNQVYKINFEWFSEYKRVFQSEYRDTLADKWILQEYPSAMRFEVMTKAANLIAVNDNGLEKRKIPSIDPDKYVVLYCSLGEVASPEYRIKVTDIAQRGSAVEVKVSISSPAKLPMKDNTGSHKYYPQDVVRIERDSFPMKGELCFIIKNQAGIKLYEKYCEVR